MTFFLIVPSVMVVISFLFHAIFNRLGLRIHFLTFVMISCLAIAANLGALAWTEIPDKFYFIKLGGIIFFAAVTATLTNYFLVKREAIEEAEFVAKVKEAYSKKTDAEENVPEVEPEKISSVLEEVPETQEKDPDKKISTEVVEVKKISEVQEKVSDKDVPVKKVSEEKISAEKNLPVAEEKFSEIQDKKISPPAKKSAEKISDAKIPAEKILKTESKAEKIVEEKIDIQKIAKSEEKLPPLTVEVKGETLDEILDYAYLEKQQGHFWQAIAAYKKALEKYRNDEYAPFVAIDLANIYKEQSFYTKAIKTIEDAMELPAVRRSSSTKIEFKKNLIYLKTVQSVLLRHKALATPFSKISRAYLQEIESEFQAMQTKFED